MTIRNVMTVLYHTGRGNPVVIGSIPIIPYHTVTDHPYSTAAILTPSSPSPALSLSLSLSLSFLLLLLDFISSSSTSSSLHITHTTLIFQPSLSISFCSSLQRSSLLQIIFLILFYNAFGYSTPVLRYVRFWSIFLTSSSLLLDIYFSFYFSSYSVKYVDLLLPAATPTAAAPSPRPCRPHAFE